MAFDSNKDKTIWEDSTDGDRGTTIIVRVASYDGGHKKIGIVRTHDDDFRKLGRMSPEECEAVIPLLQKALENVE